jgi:NAD(P)-dependent dehydrogenase (short-subunit alcohol dehydrogenase family)
MMTKVFEMRAKEAGVTVEKYLEDQAAGLPLRRMSDPEDCVGTALFLAAPASDFVTGNIIISRRRTYSYRLKITRKAEYTYAFRNNHAD